MLGLSAEKPDWQDKVLRTQEKHAWALSNRTCSAALNLSRVPATARPTGEVKEYATSKSHSLQARNSTNTQCRPRNQYATT
jgi:hypothetical protein